MATDFSFKDQAESTASEPDEGQESLESFEDEAVERTETPDTPDVSGGGQDSLDYDYTLHENVAEDLVMYSRSVQALNEAQFLLTTLGYVTGRFENPSHYVCGVIIGTSSSGKTHLQKQVEKLFPEGWLYQTTSGSDKSIIYDDEWDDPDKCIASMDELNKPGEELIEILKSLHGDDEEFNYKVTSGTAQEGAARGVDEITRTAMPYWFLYAQFEPDFELWNRLLKVPVHEGKAKNEAVLRLQFDHHNIEFSDSDYTYDFEFSDGRKALQDHIRNLPDDVWVKLPAGEDEFGGFDVAATVESIFDTQRSETNRVAAMIANLIRASALLNHENREWRDIHIPNEGVKEVIVAEPEDVANVLACRDVLLASTHELDRKKQAICSAIDAKGGTQKMATIPQIIEYLRQGDAPIVSRTQVENNLQQLREHYLVELHEGAAEDGKNMYKFLGWHNIGGIRVDEEFEERFEGTKNPITGEEFLESVRRINEDVMPGAADFSDESSVQSGSSGGQMQLGGGPDIDLEPHEEAVRAAMEEAVDGVTIENMDESEPSLYAMCGVKDLDHRKPDPIPGDVEDTVFDPDNGIWNRPDVADNWVTNEKEAFDAVDETMTNLHKKGVLRTDVIESDDAGRPVKMKISVKSEDEI